MQKFTDEDGSRQNRKPVYINACADTQSPQPSLNASAPPAVSFRQAFEPQGFSGSDLLNGCQEILESKPGEQQNDSSCHRKTKIIVNCEHTDRKHYAKGMCSTCYHKNGRTKTAWNCEHKTELHYAKGCCQECYLIFHSKRGKNKLRKLMAQKRKNLQLEKKQKEEAEAVSSS